MTETLQELLELLSGLAADPFRVSELVEQNRLLPRSFPVDLPISVQYQRYPGHLDMVGDNWLHWHDYYELFVPLGGSGIFSNGNERYAFKAGDIILVDPLKLHGVHQMEASHSALVIVFPAIAALAASHQLEKLYLAAWDQRPHDKSSRIPAESAEAAEVAPCILNIAKAWFGKQETPFALAEIHQRLLLLLHTLSKSLDESSFSNGISAKRKRTREQRLRSILDYIAVNSGSALKQSEVAAFAGMSVSRFRVFFKETIGWRFDQYVRNVRLENAAVLIRETERSIADIANETGFSDQSHLQRAFKDRYHTSPLQYRKGEH